MNWKTDYAALPTRLAAARRRSGLTQPELAERLGTSLTTIQRVETGRADPKLSLVVRWAAAVGLRLHLTATATDPSNLTVSADGVRTSHPETGSGAVCGRSTDRSWIK